MMDNARTLFNASSSSPAPSATPLRADDDGDDNDDDDGRQEKMVEDGTASLGGVPVKLWKMIMEEVYQRSVGPDVDETKKYKSFSSETYGELNPSYVPFFLSFLYFLCHHTVQGGTTDDGF